LAQALLAGCAKAENATKIADKAVKIRFMVFYLGIIGYGKTM
jgi:hypothetical protein